MPAIEFVLAVFWADEFLPDEPPFETVGAVFFDLMDHIFEIPSWTRRARHLELKNTETYFVLRADHPVEHEYQHHPVGGATIVKRFCEPRIIITPQIEFEVVVGVVRQVLSIQTAVGAALVVIGVTGGRIASNPLLWLAGCGDTSEVDRYVGHIVHVVREEQDGVAM